MLRGPDRIRWPAPTPADLLKMKMVQDRASEVTQCGCIGPQNGQPVCPCQMRNVQIKDGRYIRVQDLGPARPD